MQVVAELSLVTASISFTVTETKLFKTMRELIKSKNDFLGDLVSCGYCFGHWVSFALTIIYKPRIFRSWKILDYFLTSLVIAWLSGIQWIIMNWLMKTVGK